MPDWVDLTMLPAAMTKMTSMVVIEYICPEENLIVQYRIR
jgi:hypothetical protein